MYGKFLSKQRFSIIMVLCMGGWKKKSIQWFSVMCLHRFQYHISYSYTYESLNMHRLISYRVMFFLKDKNHRVISYRVDSKINRIVFSYVFT